MKYVQVTLEDELHVRFKQLCVVEAISLTEKMGELVRKEVEKEN
jgi:hypothetical protein